MAGPKQENYVAEGERFGRGVVTGLVRMPLRPSDAHQGCKRGRPGATLRCDCGKTYDALINHLIYGVVSSCGCLRRELGQRKITLAIEKVYRHGLSDHFLYQTWSDMMGRCFNPNSASYRWYGARGVTVAERWHEPGPFIADILESLGPRPIGKSIDRIDPFGNYEPGNVRWATPLEQSRNQRPRKAAR